MPDGEVFDSAGHAYGGIICKVESEEGHGDIRGVLVRQRHVVTADTAFRRDADKLPKQVLVETIGVAVLGADQQEDETTPIWQRSPQPAPTITRFQSYELSGEQFVPAAEIPIDNTLPVGKGGYGGWVRYLVTARSGDYVEIIIDPYRDQRTWVKSDRAVIFSDLIGRVRPVNDEIDIFVLSAETKLYAVPRPAAAYEVLRLKGSQGKVFYPVMFRDDFVQIGLRSKDQDDIGTVDGEPLGWIKARDDQGRIAFHLFTYTWN